MFSQMLNNSGQEKTLKLGVQNMWTCGQLSQSIDLKFQMIKTKWLPKRIRTSGILKETKDN